MTPHMIRTIGWVCFAFAAFIAVAAGLGLAENYGPPLPPILAFLAIGGLCLWLASRSPDRDR